MDYNTWQPNLNETLTAVGALAELLNFFHKALLEKGFTEENAIRLTEKYLEVITGTK